MIHRFKGLMFVVILYAVIIGGDVQAYMTTFVNDSLGKLAVFNELDKSFMCIPKHGKRRFGNHHKHANFVVYLQQPKVKIEIWTPAYTCMQNRCDNCGNALLKFSDIRNNTEAAALFTIIKHKPHSSMVGELPMIQKQSCQLCEEE